MTNRSNHMPTLTRMDRTKTSSMLVRIFLNQKNCGTITLQVTIVQNAHQYGAGRMCMQRAENERIGGAVVEEQEALVGIAAVPGDEKLHRVGVADNRAGGQGHFAHQFHVPHA